MDTNSFSSLFSPRSIAFVGVSKDVRKWGFIILNNIIRGQFQGSIYPVNPKEKEVLGLKVYPSVSEIPKPVDLAVIVVPPPAVSGVVAECVAKGIKSGIVITAGFAELGGEGRRLQEEMVKIARGGGMRLVGPNCLGVLSMASNMHVIMPSIHPMRGSLAIISQSGNVVSSSIARGNRWGIGFSRCISSGNEADLHCEDFLEFLEEDHETKVIMAYVEGFRDGRRFFNIAKRVAKRKPIVMIKAGTTEAGAQAAKSHTAALSGSDSACDAMCKQAGIIRVQNIDDMFNIGAALLHQPLPRGRRVGIITAGGGWGVLASDACAKAGLDVVRLSDETIRELNEILPAWWNRGNPVDLVTGFQRGGLRNCINTLLRSRQVDGVIVLGAGFRAVTERLSRHPEAESHVSSDFTSNPMVIDDIATFREIPTLMSRYGKPIVLASDSAAMAEVGWESGPFKVLRDMEIMCYPLPDQAAEVLASLARYSEYLGR